MTIRQNHPSFSNSDPSAKEYRILIYPDEHDENKVYAHCLDLDFIVVADSSDEALKKIINIIDSFVSQASDKKWIDEISEPADLKYWRMIQNAKKKEVDNIARQNKYSAFEYSL